MAKDLKLRISKRTGIKGKPLEQVKLAVVPKSIYQRPRYLEDGTSLPFLHSPFAKSLLTRALDDIVVDLLSEGEMLGLDHLNKTRTLSSKGDSIFIR